MRPISQEDIGELENSIIHKRSSADGKVYSTTIFKQQMKSAEFSFKTNQIEPDEYAPLLLTEEIILDVNFNSDKGFTINYSDFRVEHTDIEYNQALKKFYTKFYFKLKELANNTNRNELEESDWNVGKKLIGDVRLLNVQSQ